MESNSNFQPKEVPNSQVDPSPQPACFHHHPLHHFHQYHYHWVYPPFLCGHVPIPICPCHSPKTNESLPNGSPAQSNATNTVSAQQEDIHNKHTIAGTSNASMGCQSPAVQPPCWYAPRHPAMHLHAPSCPHHYFPPCRAHGYWQCPCMMAGRPPCPPIPWCPLPHMHSMPSSCPANTAPGDPHLNTVEAFSGHAEGEPTASHIGAEIWHREGEIQANQDGAMEEAYELEEEEEEPVFVLTDEWMEFFAKSEARRQQKKKQQQKEAKKLRKAARSAPKKRDGEVEISESAEHASADATSSALS